MSDEELFKRRMLAVQNLTGAAEELLNAAASLLQRAAELLDDFERPTAPKPPTRPRRRSPAYRTH